MAFDRERLLALPPRVTHHRFTRRDTMLYALGVGAGQQPGDLPFVYEENLAALPTMAVVLAYPGFWQKEPEYGIDWKRVLHAEQSVVFHAPLPIEGDVRGELTIDHIVDKGAAKGALLYSTRKIFDAADDKLLASVTQVSFLRGDGGCGGPSTPPRAPHSVPDAPADATVAIPTRPEQALIYRLSGDYNPLHADPAVAAEAGLAGPILHGLCTYGMAGRALLAALCDNRPERMQRLDCRFTAPVFPGDTLELALWRGTGGAASFRVRVPERDALVLDNGYVEFAS
ncbi:MAG: 3-alpha,7-alpha,12-alpha-trihydroxy-5-beta-cholest-24-enoyl-CoA hydratase [Sphingopyxis macrogoltabida]|uniref:3-alpha,7-alpha, 12-alpha-trihydroxy-5-beta-cholest-24-enoyl-CoA hydratase n=1 Tax=Sphingopyxis macrogoltabida TaxID=33050 RepID=A0A2W5LAY1_SPHMC|nr:MAG: 3-alpha,7-alpha,12-alpha-trihydroxy-5-beta-cholest-24-enoyl-CoA hydratase [Sphingopyxis macrogoltabida]